MKRIAIIGSGWVGHNTLHTIHDQNPNNKVTMFEVNSERLNSWKNGQAFTNDKVSDQYSKENKMTEWADMKHYDEFNGEEYDYIIVTLPTYINDNTELNPELFDKEMINLKKFGNKLILRTTLPLTYIKTLEEWDVNYWPEFGSMGDVMHKNIRPNRQVFHATHNSVIKDIFTDQLIAEVGLGEGIFIKDTHNSYDAFNLMLVKIFGTQAEEFGVDINVVTEHINPLLRSTRDSFRFWADPIGGFYKGDTLNVEKTLKDEKSLKLVKALLEFNE